MLDGATWWRDELDTRLGDSVGIRGGYFQDIFEKAPVGMVLEDSEGRFVESNPALQALLGYGEEELLGSLRSDLTYPEDEVKDAKLYEELFKGEREGFRTEKRYVRKDGSVVWGRLSASLLTDAGGKFAFVLSVVEDIDERKKTEEELEEREERYRAVIEQSTAGIFLEEAASRRVLETNPALREMLGYTAGELAGMEVYDLIAHSREDVDRNMRPGLEARGRSIGEWKLRRKDGSLLDVEVSVGGTSYGGKEVVCVTVRDITERKRAEEALRASERRAGAVIEQSPMSIHVFSPEGRALTSNASWNELWGLEEGETPQGTNIFEDEQLIESGLLAYVKESLEGVQVATPPLLYDPARVGREGSPRWLEAYVYPVEDEGGGVLEMVLVIEDVTGREEVREELEKSEERFRAMVSNASDIVTVLEPDGTILYDSPAVERVLGYTPDERIGENAFGYVHPDDLGTVREVCAEVARRGGPLTVEYRHRHKDGSSWRYVESVGSKPSGRLGEWSEAIVINTRDVTDRVLAEEKLRLKDRAVSESSNAIIITDPSQPDNPLVYVNPAFVRDTGYTAEEAIGRNCRFLQGTDRDQPAINELRIAVREERECTVVVRNYRKDGSLFYNQISIYPVRDEDGRLANYVGVQDDITERVLAEEELRLKNRAIDASFNGIQIAGPYEEGNPILYVNPHWESMTGYTQQEVLGRNPHFLQGSDRDQPDARRLRGALEEGREWFGVLRNYRKDGALFYNEMYVSPVRDDGKITHWVGVHNDITERKGMEEQLTYQAFHDSLTGLPNRALFKDRLDQALGRADRLGSTVAILYMDLDNFKYVNDSLGHEAGDELLIGVAERLRWSVRPGDTAARLGGDEFAVLLEEVGGAEDATKVAGRIAEELREPLAIRGQDVFASASIGVASSARGRAGDLLRDADAAMYEAKREGKNRYKVFEAGMGHGASERLGLENDLRRALRRGELRLHYQPEVLLQGGRTVGVEALLRWERPGRGLVPPAEFVSIAEETGLIVSMGHWVLREACRQAREWRGRYADAPTVWVNLSARQLHQADLAGELSGILNEAGLPPEGLGLEITESVLVEYGGTAISTLNELRALGVKLAIDDFGTGYSSLSYLKRLPVDLLKVDRSFVAGIDKSPEDEVLIAAVINLAQALDLRVVAEGVETPDQLRKLRSLGCDFAQGYLFSRPLPAEEAMPFLDARW
jgi:diguanylate cyclase (GGDEF)-like protein/PAS domain S-box-containing protein